MYVHVYVCVMMMMMIIIMIIIIIIIIVIIIVIIIMIIRRHFWPRGLPDLWMFSLRRTARAFAHGLLAAFSRYVLYPIDRFFYDLHQRLVRMLERFRRRLRRTARGFAHGLLVAFNRYVLYPVDNFMLFTKGSNVFAVATWGAH